MTKTKPALIKLIRTDFLFDFNVLQLMGPVNDLHLYKSCYVQNLTY